MKIKLLLEQDISIDLSYRSVIIKGSPEQHFDDVLMNGTITIPVSYSNIIFKRLLKELSDPKYWKVSSKGNLTTNVNKARLATHPAIINNHDSRSSNHMILDIPINYPEIDSVLNLIRDDVAQVKNVNPSDVTFPDELDLREVLVYYMLESNPLTNDDFHPGTTILNMAFKAANNRFENKMQADNNPNARLLHNIQNEYDMNIAKIKKIQDDNKKLKAEIKRLNTSK